MKRVKNLSILDVAAHCGIKVKQNVNGNEVRVRCPFCGSGHGKPTATINMGRNSFHCHKCGESLNALMLYGKMAAGCAGIESDYSGTKREGSLPRVA